MKKEGYEEKEKLQKDFVKTLNEMGIYRIKDIPNEVRVVRRESKEVWVIK